MDIISILQKKIKDKIDNLKNHAAYSVDTVEELKYVRGQIKSLEDLQQELKDLLNKQEIEDDNVHGETETDWET